MKIKEICTMAISEYVCYYDRLTFEERASLLYSNDYAMYLYVNGYCVICNHPRLKGV